MIKAVFFDVGGVLLKQDSSVMLELHDREKGWRAGTSAGLWKEYLDVAHVGGELLPGYRRNGEVERIKRRLYATNRMVSGMEALVRELGEVCRLAVISNFTADLNQVLDQLGLLPSFELIVNSALVGVKKPDTKIYEIACNRLGVEPGEAVFIDDNAENVTAAQTTGMRGIVFSSAGTLRNELCAAGLVLRHL
jgi:epoxide hydrolase-like predicted phosphatase